MTSTISRTSLDSSTATESSFAETRSRAMGSRCHVIVNAPLPHQRQLLDRALARIDELERRWSRFLTTSEVSELNAASGRPLAVSADTRRLIEAAFAARRASAGRFDPTMLAALQANGYDRTFVSLRLPTGSVPLALPAGGAEPVIDHTAGTVSLPDGVGFDPGGIGKGLAADMVVEELMDHGAAGALVNLGGDLRCAGVGPHHECWPIEIGDDVAGAEPELVMLQAGAIASSTCKRRRWLRRTADGAMPEHHLLDPATGRSSVRAATLVTVVAARAADAEWLATALAATGEPVVDPAMIGDAAVIIVDADGRRHSMGAPERFLP